MLPAIASVPIVVVACGVLGVIVGLIALRLEGDYLAIVTLFVGQAFVEIVNNVDSGTFGGNNGLPGLAGFHSFGGHDRRRHRLLLRDDDRAHPAAGGAAPARALADRPRLAGAARRPARRVA